jgi:heterodisulfide reductase subunit B
MLGVDNELSMDLLERKIADARLSGADYLCVACPYCQLQFDRIQRMLISERKGNRPIPSILYTQLLGLALGIDRETLGIGENELDISGIMTHLTKP